MIQLGDKVIVKNYHSPPVEGEVFSSGDDLATNQPIWWVKFQSSASQFSEMAFYQRCRLNVGKNLFWIEEI
jgi:hypothetical protein